MSFIDREHRGWTYNPGYFLAYNDERVSRETRQIAQDSPAAVTAEDGTKYVPMGSAWPSDDANAVGILYEDVDVTTGDMPGSVVTGGATVFEDRLAPTNVAYAEATPGATDSPMKKGLFEKIGDEYFRTTDKTVRSGKTYYSQTVTRMSDAAKTALKGLGFKFIVDVPKITRPDWEV